MRGVFDIEFERTDYSDQGYAIIGRALAYAQGFEGDCRALRKMLEAKAGTLDESLFDDEQSFRDFIEAIHREPLSKQLGRITKMLHLTHDVDEVLHLARASRNEIAHEVCLGRQFDIETIEGRTSLVNEVSIAIRRIAEAHLVMLVLMTLVARESLPAGHYLDSYCERVVEWICETDDSSGQ